MEAIFLFLVSAAGVSHCRASDVPSARHGFSNGISTTPAKHLPPVVAAAPPSAPSRASVFYDGPSPHPRHPSRERTVASSHGNPNGIVKSSLTLSKDYLEKLLHGTGELEWFPEGKYCDGCAVLTTDVYQGKRMLVYKLAPGDVFAGKRTTASASKNHEDIKKSQSNAVHFDVHENPHEYSDSGVVLSGYGRREGNIKRNFIRRPVSKWGVQYLESPPPLASMANPYLPSGGDDSSLGSRARPKYKPGRRVKKPGVGTQKEEVVAAMQRQVAQTVQAARNTGRGIWLSLLLLHYLGFLPQLPGLPRHTDPDEVAPTVVNTP